MRTARLASLIIPLSLGYATVPAERIRVNDNATAAGSVSRGVLTVRLDVRAGMWHPDRDADPGVEVLAFGETGKPLQVPGPLIRATEGTEIRVTIRNSTDTVLVVRGFAADTVQVAPKSTRDLRFQPTASGTYYYWASSGGPLLRNARESLLGGAIVIDPKGAARDRNERVLVLNVWGDGDNLREVGERMRMVINGKAWPNTQRFTYQVGDSVRWRVINISADVHPMHLHGFYFRVDARGDGRVDSTYARTAPAHLAVTERVAPGRTIAMTWVPERAGNWLFHCHDNFHIQSNVPLSPGSTAAPHTGHHDMGNLVMGVHVRGRTVADAGRPRRQLRLIARADTGGTSAEPAFGYVLDEPGVARSSRPMLPGPAMILRRGEPVAITVVNELPEETAVHWHGIELESYFDGVAGFAGAGNRLAPHIRSRDSFVVRFTPPRAGTFMYHTHVDEVRQQRAGLWGPLLVLEPDATHDPATDIVLMLATPRREADQAVILLNGSTAPAPLELIAGTRYRIRVLNIHTYRPNMRVELKGANGRERWRAIGKDGATLPPAVATVRPAYLPISNGETYDFEYTPSAPGALRIDVTAGNGQLLGTQPVNVR